MRWKNGSSYNVIEKNDHLESAIDLLPKNALLCKNNMKSNLHFTQPDPKQEIKFFLENQGAPL